jgi:copper transport protein
VRALVRGGVLLLGVALGVILLARPADAHARLVRSEPANGAVLAQAPRVATLWFDEDISKRLSSARLIDIRGAAVNGVRTEEAGGPEQLKIKLPELTPGTYGLVWRALAEDGHATNGLVVFTIGPAAPTGTIPFDQMLADGGSAGTAAAPGEVLLRWLSLCLLAGTVGGLAMAGPILGRAAIAADPALSAGVRRARRRLLAVVVGCAALAASVGVASLLAESRRVMAGTGRPLMQAIQDLLSGPRWGQAWLASEAALVILAVLVFALRSRLSQPRRWLSAAAGGVVLLVLAIAWLRALSSHAGAAESARTSAVLADAAHILTALFWLGALPALVLVFWPQNATVGRSELIRAIRRPFTGLVLVSATILVASGLYGAGREVPELDQVMGTSYGRTLVVKSALLAALGGLGLANSVLLHGRVPTRLGRPLGLPTGGAVSRRLVLVEAGVGAVLLVAAAFLADTAPPRPTDVENAAAASAAGPASQGGTISDLVVSLTAGPNRPGVNGLTVLVASSRRPPPAPVTSVTLTFKETGRTPTDVRLREIEPGRYFGAGNFSHPGSVNVTAVIRRGGEVLPIAFIWTVESEAASAPPPQPRSTSPPLAPYVNGLALCLLALAVIVGVWRVSRSRRARSVDIVIPERVKILEDVR